MRRLPVFALALMLGTTACLEDTPTGLEPQLAVSSAATGAAGQATYRVTLYNLSTGQPFTPPLAVVHRNSIGLFEMGEPASFEIQQIAENGNLGPMIDLVSTSRQVKDYVVTFGPTKIPVLPGEMVEFEIEGLTGAKYLSIVSMLICTNDGFTGLNAVRLPKRVGDVVSIDAVAYDAGTEENTEAFTDLVPPCGPLTGFDSQGQGTGMSNPALAEGGVVSEHLGISGGSDLEVDPHDWIGPIARVVVERIG